MEDSLLRYQNMPGQAQFLPDKEALSHDKGTDLEVCQCAGCGLVQLSSNPVPYYRDVIRSSAFSPEMKSFRKKQFEDFVRIYGLSGKKVIETGCGGGEYLSILKQTGVDAYGLEHRTGSVAECRTQGLNVSPGFVEDSGYTIENSPFDAFMILNFLEHLPDPGATLRGIYNNLADGAAGLVEVPNFEMILQKRLFAEFIPDHLSYFTRATLSTALVLNGFDLLECKDIWHGYILSAVVRKRGRLDLTSFHRQETEVGNEIQTYIGSFPEGKVAVWGAGHQAFAVMALADLSGRVKYVVDSAPFKQGKYTPATHIPIVAPDALRSDPVDAVIVMAASYSEEVAGVLRRDFDNRMRIAILRDYGLEYLPE
ncbi:MAG: methyltransferase domain-containing protein [Syntrophobacteraceae bacterium]